MRKVSERKKEDGIHRYGYVGIVVIFRLPMLLLLMMATAFGCITIAADVVALAVGFPFSNRKIK